MFPAALTDDQARVVGQGLRSVSTPTSSRERPDPLRQFSATIATETNTVSPLRAPVSSKDAPYLKRMRYRCGLVLQGYGIPAARRATGGHSVHVYRPAVGGAPACRGRGLTPIEGSCFVASLAGTTNRAGFEFMCVDIPGQLKAALPLSGGPLGLHGAWWCMARMTTTAT